MNKELGRLGEQLAADYLTIRGYEIIERNYRTRRGEIDLICRDNRMLVFVEVKTRLSVAMGFPEEAITFTKRQKIFKTALQYLATLSRPHVYRFDCLSIMLKHNLDLDEICHLKDIFE